LPNILTAFTNIVKSHKTDIETFTSGNNRMNSMGEGLESYIKDIFADTIGEMDEGKKLQKISETFSYTGNKTNPPDMMLKNGDAIEVKKIESESTNLQLNSSHPKSKLLISNPKINQTCRDCEDWSEKDLIYVIGYLKKKKLNSMWMVYGDCYAADEETYAKVEDEIKESINSIGDLEINRDTFELSGVKNVDPLNITYLRVRGMWIIENPSKVFRYLYEYDKDVKFQLIALMKSSKYDSFSNEDKLSLEANKDITIQDVKIKNPNNPANLIDSKLLVFKVL
jgi:hypothetical protein